MLQLDGVTKTYRTDKRQRVSALDGINMSVTEGEFLAIIGPTGSGKSTLLELIAGLIEPTAGTIRLNGAELRGPDERVSIVFQDDSTFPWLTVRENVTFGLRMRKVDAQTRRERTTAMLALMGLEEFADAYPSELSGGMRQRVAIGRSLVLKPDVLLLDEPFGALDEQSRLLLGFELLDIWNETDATILFVTHNINEAILLADRIAVMSARPGEIRRIVENPLQRPRTADMIDSSESRGLFSELWNSLEPESRKQLGRQHQDG